MYNKTIIKTKIIEKGTTQKEIAKVLKIREETLSRIINDKKENIDTFIKLCKILEIEISDFHDIIEIEKEP